MFILGNRSAFSGLACAVAAAVLAPPARAQVETVIYSFSDGIDGAVPLTGLINVGGTLYGTTWYGGLGGGTIFSVTPSGTESVLVPFNYPTFAYSLINVGGTLYGTTLNGGYDGCYGACGTLFSLSVPGGNLTQLFAFVPGKYRNAGYLPLGRLVSVGEMLYGTDSAGGTGYEDKKGCNCGAVFAATLSGATKPVYVFKSNPSPGGGLTNIGGRLFGTTYNSIYSVSIHGGYKVLYTFGPAPDGSGVVGDLTNLNGTLYGTTTRGGAYGAGTVFKVTSAGVETVLHSFGASGDGSFPQAGVTEMGGALYGTTWSGGAYGSGTVYQLTQAGQEALVYSFKINSGDGAFPGSKLIPIGNTLYGTTAVGGANGYGTVFSLVP